MRRNWQMFFFVFALVSTAQSAIPAAVEIPFESREGLLWVKAVPAQSTNSLNLLLDTGAAVSVLNTSTADGLGLNHGRKIAVQGVGRTLAGYGLKPIALTAKGEQLPSPSLAVDLEKFSSSFEQPVDGLLGADFFRGRIVQIDFETRTLRILSAPPANQNAESIALQLRPCGIRIPININGRKAQWVRLDTGCLSALQWVTSTVRPSDCMRKAAIGLTPVSIPQTETTVQIGSRTFEKVPTGIHEQPIFMGEAGLLGNGLLSRFSKITIDAKSGHLIVEPLTPR